MRSEYYLVAHRHPHRRAAVHLLVVDVPLVPRVFVDKTLLGLENLLDDQAGHGDLDVDPVEAVGDGVGGEDHSERGQGAGGRAGVIHETGLRAGDIDRGHEAASVHHHHPGHGQLLRPAGHAPDQWEASIIKSIGQ